LKFSSETVSDPHSVQVQEITLSITEIFQIQSVCSVDIQRVHKRGAVEKISRVIGRTINVALFRSPSGFLTSFFPGGIGLKQMTALDLQDLLSKRLKRFGRLVDEIDADDVLKSVNSVGVPAGANKVYRFHETSLENLEKIRSRGLKTSEGQFGRGVYFSPEIGKGEASGRGLLLRAKVDDIKPLGFDEFVDVHTGKIDEGFVERSVPSRLLEFSSDGGKTWNPLIQ